MTEVDDMTGLVDVLQKLLGSGTRRIGTGQQNCGVDVSLHGTFRIALLHRAKIEAPVGGERFGRELGIGIDEMRRILQKQDSRRASFADAIYFSTVTYTTLGYGDIILSHKWQVTSSLQAVSGIILFGWSTAFLVNVRTFFWKKWGIDKVQR